MSEKRKQTFEKIKEDIESDTDNENDVQNKNNINNKNKNNGKGNTLAFNQSNQNFAKFSQMAKNNNQSSFSDQSLSKEESINNDHEDFAINDRGLNNMIENENRKNITLENKKKSETLNSDIDKNLKSKKKDFDNSNNEENEDSFDDFNNGYKHYNNTEYERESQKLTFFDVDQFFELNVDQDAKNLLNLMKKFQPDRNILNLDTKMKPFIPSYISSIGEVDAFLKINRPDFNLEELGLEVIDEPTINGIDPSVFSLELAYKMKSKVPDNFIIKSIENAEKNSKQIQNWIESLENLHKEASSNFVSYSKKMPEIEDLMQVWPEQLEIIFKEFIIPKEDLSISTDSYAKIICNLLDIPIHNKNSNNNNDNSIIEALHVLFSLYSEFKENKHFQNEEHKIKNQNVMKFH